MERTARIILAGIFGIGFIIFTALAAVASTSGSHYPTGFEGVTGASVPPPGFHFRSYNLIYPPTTLTDDNGDDIPIGFDLSVVAMAERFIHVTKYKILGADFFYNVIVPIVHQDLDISALGVSDTQGFGLGDILFEGGLAWHLPRFDFASTLAVITPTGDFDVDKPASLGLGYWSGMLTLGGTAYFDDAKTWSLSVLTRTLVNSEQTDTNVTPGSEFVMEWGVGKQIPVTEKLLVRPGITGFEYWQFTDDSGDNSDDLKKQAHAIGGEINFFWLPPTLLQLNLRFLQEYNVNNGPKGSRIVFTLTKSW
jgi:hypothetical protein